MNLLDLILLKPRVFLHLLYNRCHRPLLADKVDKTTSTSDTPENQAGRVQQRTLHGTTLRADFGWLMLATIVAETAIRLFRSSAHVDIDFCGIVAVRVAVLVAAELVAQLGVSSMIAMAILHFRDWWPCRPNEASPDGRQKHFTRVSPP